MFMDPISTDSVICGLIKGSRGSVLLGGGWPLDHGYRHLPKSTFAAIHRRFRSGMPTDKGAGLHT